MRRRSRRKQKPSTRFYYKPLNKKFTKLVHIPDVVLDRVPYEVFYSCKWSWVVCTLLIHALNESERLKMPFLDYIRSLTPISPDLSPSDVSSIRAYMGYTQRELAERLGVSLFTIWAWEHGKRRMSPSSQARFQHLVSVYFPQIFDKECADVPRCLSGQASAGQRDLGHSQGDS
ncbi:MAG: hypothetical protein QXT73_00625 [Candidatus Methanomethylicaceae archaeon]